jgi:hypothetical protein
MVKITNISGDLAPSSFKITSTLIVLVSIYTHSETPRIVCSENYHWEVLPSRNQDSGVNWRLFVEGM